MVLVVVYTAYGDIFCVNIEGQWYAASLINYNGVDQACGKVWGYVYFLVCTVDDVCSLVQASVVLFVLLWFA